MAAPLVRLLHLASLPRLALLDHINLNVPDRDMATSFYVQALGGQINPETTNARQVHVNVRSPARPPRTRDCAHAG